MVHAPPLGVTRHRPSHTTIHTSPPSQKLGLPSWMAREKAWQTHVEFSHPLGRSKMPSWPIATGPSMMTWPVIARQETGDRFQIPFAKSKFFSQHQPSTHWTVVFSDALVSSECLRNCCTERPLICSRGCGPIHVQLLDHPT